jgi:hypothetical protein
MGLIVEDVVVSGASNGEERVRGALSMVAVCSTRKVRMPKRSKFVVTCPPRKAEGKPHHA